MAKRRLTTVLLVLITLGLMCKLFVFSVRVDQVAAQYRWGKVVRIIRPRLELGGEAVLKREAPASLQGVHVVETAGWFFKLPWPIDKVKPVDQSIRVVDGPIKQSQLSDANQLIPRVYATWRVIDPVAFEQTFMGDEASAEDRLKEVIGGRTSDVMGPCALSDLVNVDPTYLKFDQIERDILDRVKAAVEAPEKGYGIEVCDLGITWIALPEDATAAVFSRMELERRTEAEKLTEEGKAMKRAAVAEANQARDILLATAEADARRIRADGEAEAAKSYEVFAADQEFAIFLRRLEALRLTAIDALEAQRPLTFVLSTKTPLFRILEGLPKAGDVPGLGELTAPGAVPAPTTGGGQ